MMSNKVKSEINLRALDGLLTTTQNIMDLILIIPIFNTSVPYHSGKVVIQLD